MTGPRPLPLVTLAFAAVLGLSSCATSTQLTDAPTQPSSTAATPPTPTAADASTAAPKTFSPAVRKGVYLSYAAYQANPSRVEGRTVVLFFHATWCHTCQAADESLTTEGVPDGLAVVKVDYDSQTALKRTYGVTVQHTFVQIDEQGNKVKVWSGSTTGADIAKHTA